MTHAAHDAHVYTDADDATCICVDDATNVRCARRGVVDGFCVECAAERAAATDARFEPRGLWTAYHKSTGKRATIAAFNTRAQVESQIREWQRRQDRGKRPDVDAYDLEARPATDPFP